VAALSGVVFIVLLMVSLVTSGNAPGTDTSATTVRNYYLAHQHKTNVSMLATSLAVLVGLFFYGYLRALFRTKPGNDWLSTVFFGGAVIFGLGGLVGAGVDAIFTDVPHRLTASEFQLLNMVRNDLNWPMTSIGLGILYFAAGFIIYRSRVLPLWLGWVSWIFAVAAGSLVFAFVPLLGTALWVVVVSILMAVRNPSLTPAQSATPPAGQDEVHAPSVAATV
jgi:hypothetical protein